MIDKSFVFDLRECRAALEARLAEPAPSRIQLLVGPRQVGKTTLLLELARGLGVRCLYVALDGPEAAGAGFIDRTFRLAEERATALAGGSGEPTPGRRPSPARAAPSPARGAPALGPGSARPFVLLLDEIAALPDWSARLKGEWDRILRKRLPIHVVATGSSALRLGAGSRESLAGRFERLVLSHWSPRALAANFDVSPAEAVSNFVSGGAYPGAFGLRHDPARFLAYLRDGILDPALVRDILAIEPVRKPALLRQVFAVCAAHPASIVALQKLQGQLQDRGALETISHYLELLAEAFLVAPLQKYSDQPHRRRNAPPKLVVLDNGLLAAADPRGAPDPKREPTRYGAWVENACLARAKNAGFDVTYWREEPWEVDGVVSSPAGDFAIEIKTGTFDSTDLRGLLTFTTRHPRFRPLVLCEPRMRLAAERAGVDALDWRSFLWSLFRGEPLPGPATTED